MYLTFSRYDIDKKNIESFKAILALKFPELLSEAVYEYQVGGKLKLEYVDCDLIKTSQQLPSIRTSIGTTISLLEVMKELTCIVKYNRHRVSDSEFIQKFQRYIDPEDVSESTVVKVSAPWNAGAEKFLKKNDLIMVGSRSNSEEITIVALSDDGTVFELY